MTGQELFDQVEDELRNISIEAKINRWIKNAAEEIANTYVFGTLHTRGSKTTTDGNPDINLDSDFMWLKTIQIPAEQRKLEPEDEVILAELHPDYRVREGTVTSYYLNGNILGLYMVPSSVVTITYAYQRQPDPIDSYLDTQYTEFPTAWHPYIAQRAITNGYQYDRNSDGVLKSEAQEGKLLKTLRANIYRRLDSSTVMGVRSRTGRKPGRPTFPRNIVIP